MTIEVTAIDSFKIESRGLIVHTMQCPVNCDRSLEAFKAACGDYLIINGQKEAIESLDTFAVFAPLSIGDSIGVGVRDTGETYYSSDEEVFTAEGIYEVYVDAFAREEVEIGEVLEIYSANFKTYPASHYFPDVKDLVDTAAERAYDVSGEFASDWDDILYKTEYHAELDAVISEAIDAWATKHDFHPRFGEHVRTNPSIFVKAISEDEYEVVNDPKS